MEMFKATMIAGSGGFLGTCLRFCSEKLGAILCTGIFPLGTFMANMLGCFLIGIFYGLLTKTTKFGKTQDLLWITGFCGGFTTFSSFSDEMTLMLERGQDAMFWTYMLTSIVAGLILVVIGVSCVRGKDTAASTVK